MARNQVAGDLDVTGTLTVGSMVLPDNAVRTNATVQAGANIAYSKLAQRVLASIPLKIEDWRIHDDPRAVLPNAAGGSDDLYFDDGTWGTNAWLVKSDDSGQTSITQRAAQSIRLPFEYEDGETVTIRIPCAMQVVSDGTATIDVECYASDGDGTLSADLCATAAQSMNSTDWANKDFTITPTTLTASMVLFVRITVAIVDTNTVADHMTALISDATLLCDTRG
jgi:hypothetical protein